MCIPEDSKVYFCGVTFSVLSKSVEVPFLSLYFGSKMSDFLRATYESFKHMKSTELNFVSTHNRQFNKTPNFKFYL